jgi:hypothetical protein
MDVLSRDDGFNVYMYISTCMVQHLGMPGPGLERPRA